MKKNCFVIILAAGKSLRMKGTDKILKRLINNKEVIVNTIEHFDRLKEINKIILVIRNDIIDKLKNILKQYHFLKDIYLVSGGETRTQSLFNGFDFVKSNFFIDNDSYILIHDGARPNVEAADILTCLNNAIKFKASALGLKVNDTLKKISDNFIIDTIDRDNLFYIQTPQIFNFMILEKAINKAKEKNLNLTDDCQLLEFIGEKIYISQGSKLNIKITTPQDLILVNQFLKIRKYKKEGNI